MKFSQIEMLFLIWAIPVFFLVVVYGMKNRQNILSRFASAKALSVIAPEANSGRRWVKAAMVLCSLLFICLALSGPQYGYKWQTIEQKGVDIIAALDLSRSMLATDIQPTRLDRAKREIYDLLAMLKGDRMGLVAFSGTAFLQCPLTLDYEAFNIFLNSLSPDSMPVGGTDISGAVTTSLSAFDQKTTSQKAIILITDGENTGKDNPLEVAENARKAGVKLFCIGVGSQEGVPVPSETGGIKKDRSGNIILTRIDEETLKKMAALTGGAYVRSVAGGMDLDLIYTQEIRGKMETATLATDKKQIWEDRFQWVLALAIIALGAELLVPAAVRKKAAMSAMAFLLLWSVPVHAANPLKEGIDAYNLGAYDKALKLFIDAQLDQPDRPDILYNIGNAYYHTGDYEAAAKSYQEALKSENKLLQQKAHYNLGNADFRKKQYEAALKNYEEALKLNPDDIQARQNLDYVKKVMEQVKEQKDQQQKGDKSDKSEKKEDPDAKEKKQDPSKEGQDGEKNSAQEEQLPKDQDEQSKPDEKNAEKDNPSPDFGEEMTDQDGKGPEPPKETAGKEADQQIPEDKKQQDAVSSMPDGDPENSEEQKRAEQILNRLKDQPGKAMIPAYGKTDVEKDW